MSATAAAVVPAHGSGSLSRSRSCRPPDPNRSLVGHGRPNASSVACTRFLSATRWRTRCSRHRARSRSARTSGVGSQIAGTSSRRANSASTHASIRSVLHANGARPLTFWASATWTCQPASSSWSCTNRAPFIDSIAAATGFPYPAVCRTSPRSPSASGGAVVTCTGSPASFITCTSSLWRDRSNPAYNMAGPPRGAPDGDTPETATGGGPSSWHSVLVQLQRLGWGRGQVGHDAEVVARPHAPDGLVEGVGAGGDVERRPVVGAADQDVVDPPAPLQRPGTVGDQWVAGGEGVAWLARVEVLPGVAVADAGVAQPLEAAPEPQAGRVGDGVEVAGHDHVSPPLGDQPLDEAGRGHRLEPALVLQVQLEVGLVVDEQQRPDGRRGLDLGHQRHRQEALGPGRQLEVDLV